MTIWPPRFCESIKYQLGLGQCKSGAEAVARPWGGLWEVAYWSLGMNVCFILVCVFTSTSAPGRWCSSRCLCGIRTSKPRQCPNRENQTTSGYSVHCNGHIPFWTSTWTNHLLWSQLKRCVKTLGKNYTRNDLKGRYYVNLASSFF